MQKRLSLTLAGIVACFVVGCATQKPNLVRGRRMHSVRTTAYTHHEGGSGCRNALDCHLSDAHVMSAASDWSHFPLGTRFRIAETNEEYIIDDYGTALVGTDTIDLYKPTRLEMKRWGVRKIDIDILQWGSEEQSLKVLAPRSKHSCVRRMVASLHQKKQAQQQKELVALDPLKKKT
jgi:3D (Asp-Asp-Asp) domain-containing protein